VWLRRERACFCPVHLLEADTTDIPAIGGVALNQVGIDQQTGAVPSLYPGGQLLLGMPEQTGSVSLVPWTMMPAPLVGMAGRLLLWLNTIELNCV
jgi:hypothetical protein